MDEWAARREVPNEGCYSIYVHSHKTQAGGAAVITLTKMEMQLVNSYIAKIRPFLDKDSSGFVFPNMRRRKEPIKEIKFKWFNSLCEGLGRYLPFPCTLSLPITIVSIGYGPFKPHDVRHFFSTDWHEQNVGNAAKMMDHHPKTAERYYAKLGGAKAKAVLSTRFRRFGEGDLNREPEPDADLDRVIAELERELAEKRRTRKR